MTYGTICIIFQTNNENDSISSTEDVLYLMIFGLILRASFEEMTPKRRNPNRFVFHLERVIKMLANGSKAYINQIETMLDSH